MTKTNVRLVISSVPVTKLVFFSFDFFRTGPQHREPKERNLSAFGRAGSVFVRSGWFACLLFFPDLDKRNHYQVWTWRQIQGLVSFED
jgi:hypothetical protein